MKEPDSERASSGILTLSPEIAHNARPYEPDVSDRMQIGVSRLQEEDNSTPNLEQIGMCSSANTAKNQRSVVLLIDQQPIGFDVALSSTAPVATQSMISVALWQHCSCGQLRYHRE